MLRTTLSAIKRVCSIAFIPRIFQGDIKYAAQKKFAKDSLITPRATKTTSSSNSGATENSDQEHKKQSEENKTDDQNVQKCVEQNLEEERERCNRIISKIFPAGDPLDATLNTNAESNKEELIQKLENLEEAALVEAPPKLNDHGRPRVLGQQEAIASNEYYYPEPNNYDNKYDDLANRCLTTPPNEVDERILKELGIQKHPNNEINFSPKRPTESYYSQVIYGQTQVIRFNKSNEAKSNQGEIQNEDLNTNMGTIYKAELIQPLIFDSVSLCECLEKGCDESSFDALEDASLNPVILNPYTNQAFPFYDYAINEDMTIETPVEEETMTVTTGVESDIGNNAVMPPAEMEIESEPREVREDLKGTIEDLGVSGETSATEPEHISNITDTADEGFVYAKSSTGPPIDWLGKNYRQPEKNVKPSTSISSKNKKDKQSNPINTAISENQNPNDITKMKRAEKYINEKPHVTEYPEANNLVYATKAKIRESDMEMDTEQASVYERKTTGRKEASQEAEKVSVFDIKTPVSNLETENRPIFEPKAPISNVQEEEKVPTERKAHHHPETIESWIRKPQNIRNTSKPSLSSNISTATGPVPDLVTEGDVTLKELLRRIRERHRQELCRDYFQQATQIEMTNTCTKSKTLGPNPCKCPEKEKPPQCPPPPKCPPPTQKDPCAPKKDPCAPKNDPCAPKKKDPCAKFSLHLGKKIHDTVSLLRLYFITNFGSPLSVNYQPSRQYCSQVLSASTVQIHSLNMKEALKVLEPDQEDIILARDYEPWTPIPSWPIQKKEKRRPFVCPKEGCKLLPPPPFNPAFKDKPCVSFPKKTFSLVELFDHPPVIRSQD